MRKFQPNGEKHNLSLYLFTTPSLQALASDNDLTTGIWLIQTTKKEKPFISIINAFNYQRHPITFTLHLDTFVHELRLYCKSLQ